MKQSTNKRNRTMREPVTPTKPPRVRKKQKKVLDFTDPFQRADPKLLEKMHREAMRKRVGDALL
jgi:hypothetical protein